MASNVQLTQHYMRKHTNLLETVCKVVTHSLSLHCDFLHLDYVFKLFAPLSITISSRWDHLPNTVKYSSFLASVQCSSGFTFLAMAWIKCILTRKIWEICEIQFPHPPLLIRRSNSCKTVKWLPKANSVSRFNVIAVVIFFSSSEKEACRLDLFDFQMINHLNSIRIRKESHKSVE